MRKIENRKKKGKGSNHKYAEAIIYADPRMEHRKDDVNDGGFARERGNLATLILRGIQPFSSFFFFFFFFILRQKKRRILEARGEASASKSGIQREFLFLVSFTYAANAPHRENEPFHQGRTMRCAQIFNETL